MNRARKLYEEIGAEAVLTKKSYLRLYLTGFESSAGYVLSDRDKDVFFTDSRYTEAARKQLAGSGIEVKEMERGMTIAAMIPTLNELDSSQAMVSNWKITAASAKSRRTMIPLKRVHARVSCSHFMI